MVPLKAHMPQTLPNKNFIPKLMLSKKMIFKCRMLSNYHTRYDQNGYKVVKESKLIKFRVAQRMERHI